MENYYTKLGLSPSATSVELQNAIDGQYNQVRRLVNHYDPNVVNQANQALVVLEEMRATLLDPQRRAAYDAAQGIGGQMVGGVADPSLAGQAPSMQPAAGSQPMMNFPVAAPPRYPMQQPVQPGAPVAAGWTCQSCATVVAPGTMFCSNCGKEVGRVCPNCQATYEARGRFCPSCGMTPEAAARKIEINGRLTTLQSDIYSLQAQANATSSLDVRSIQFLWVNSAGWALWVGLTAVLFLLGSLFRLVFSFLPGEVMGNQVMNVVLQGLGFLFGLLRWGVLAAMLAFVLWYLERQRGIKADRAALGLLIVSGLAGMLFSGVGFYYQAHGATSAWLVFPALVAGGLFTWGGVALYQHKQAPAGQALALSSARLQPVMPYMNQAVHYSQAQPLVLCGLGAVLSFALLLFSVGMPFLGIIAALIGAVVSLLLGLLAYRAWSLEDIQRASFDAGKQQAQARLDQANAELGALKTELSGLAASSGRG